VSPAYPQLKKKKKRERRFAWSKERPILYALWS
jgi:hypothetical protein